MSQSFPDRVPAHTPSLPFAAWATDVQVPKARLQGPTFVSPAMIHFEVGPSVKHVSVT